MVVSLEMNNRHNPQHLMLTAQSKHEQSLNFQDL